MKYIIKQTSFINDKPFISYYERTGTILPFRVFTTKIEDAKVYEHSKPARKMIGELIHGSGIGKQYDLVKLTNAKSNIE